MRESNSTTAPPRPTRGMTLGELVIVLVVVGILSALAIPRFNRSQAESRLDGNASKISEDVQWTRLLATKANMRSFLYFEGSARRWSLWLDKDGNNTFSSTSDSMIMQDSLSPGIRFGFGYSPPATIPVLGTSAPANGLGAITTSAVEDCAEGITFPASPLTTGTWARGTTDGLIVGCGGTTADIGNGVLYLSTADYDGKAYAIVFNHVTVGVEAFAVRRYKWTKGGTWTLQ